MAIDLRPITTADLAAICAVHNRAEAFDGIDRVMQLDELAEELNDEHVPHLTDTRVAVDHDGSIVGYAYVMFLPSDESQQRAYVFGQVDPVHRGRGVGRDLLAWGRDRARDRLLQVDNGLPMYIRVDMYDTVIDALHLAARLGFTPVRYFEELLRPLQPLPTLQTPPGVQIVPWPVGEAQRDEEIRVVKNIAFADHWGSTPTPPDRWHHLVHGPGGRPDLSHIALDAETGAVVGASLNHRYESDDAASGRRDGWIMSLSTLPAWRGRGIASALIGHSLHTFAAAGLTHASLGVDGDSPTGAARLYRALGFESCRRSITSEIEVASPS